MKDLSVKFILLMCALVGGSSAGASISISIVGPNAVVLMEPLFPSCAHNPYYKLVCEPSRGFETLSPAQLARVRGKLKWSGVRRLAVASLANPLLVPVAMNLSFSEYVTFVYVFEGLDNLVSGNIQTLRISDQRAGFKNVKSIFRRVLDEGKAP